MGKEVLNEGFTQVENKLIKHKELDCIEKMMLINFISYGDNIYPSITRICEELNISRPTCVKKINRLKEIGYLKVTKNKSLSGDYDNNSYEVVKKFNYVVNEINHGSKNNLPQVVKEINSNNTNKTILNNNIYSSSEDEDSISYFERINKEIDNLENEINNNYDRDLIQKEKDKLMSKKLCGLPLLKELKKELEIHNKKIQKEKSNKDIEEIWRLYPRKEGKQKSIKNIPKILKKHSKEELIRCIERYVKETEGTDKKFILMGSTFFNGRYADYLDSNYNDIKPKEVNRNIDYVDEIMKEMYEKGEF